MIFTYYKDPKTPKITQFGALAGQKQHMAAQKVGFTAQPIRNGPPNWLVSSSGALKKMHIRAELEKFQLGACTLEACQKHFHFEPQTTPSGKLSWCNLCILSSHTLLYECCIELSLEAQDRNRGTP